VAVAADRVDLGAGLEHRVRILGFGCLDRHRAGVDHRLRQPHPLVAVPGATSTCLKDYVPREQTHKPGDFCGFLVTKFTMDRVGPFDENFEVAYCEDIDWALRAKQKGCIVATCEDAPVFHWGSRTIVEGGVDNGPSFIRNAEYFRRKHGLSYEEARILISM